MRQPARKIGLIATAWIVAGAVQVGSAQDRSWSDFGQIIATPAGIERALERCDGHPDFETEFAIWLVTTRPRTAAERRTVAETSLQLLKDTTDGQIALALVDGLLRRALEDVKREPSIDPDRLASSLYADIARAVMNRRSKAQVVTTPAYGLAADGSVTEERQATFAEEFLKLADPPGPHHVEPVKPMQAARRPAPVSMPASHPPEVPVSFAPAGELPRLLLLVAAILLIVHVLRGRRPA